MKFIQTLAAIGGLVAHAAAAPAPAATPYVVHEKRNVESQQWAETRTKINGDAVIPMRIGLTQSNLDKAEEYLMSVSHPESPDYGKHWSMEKIAETFAAAEDTIAGVMSWLQDKGIGEDRVKLAKGKNWLNFEVTVAEAEALLQTKYKVFDNMKSKSEERQRLACDEYSVPAHLKEHIDFISPTIQFDAAVKQKRKRGPVFSRSNGVKPYSGVKFGTTIAGILEGVSPTPNVAPQPAVTFSSSNCNQYITPDCLRTLYNFSNGTLSQSSYGIVEYTPNTYLQSDLNLFYSNLARQIPSGTGPTTDLIDGATTQGGTHSFDNNGESDLDIEYAIALVYPQKITLYQAGDSTEGASFNNFLDALDSSYCSGDNPNYDSVYPDSAGSPKTCGAYTAAKVISTSYGYNEADLPASYEVRQCNEYMKLGLAGTTIVYSSGDYGVAGNGGDCCTKAKCAGGTYNSGGSGTFNPAFPATCPYITSVGATQIVSGASVTAPEEACQTVIYSGGGFSNVFAKPSYQSSAVATYFANHKPSYTATQYNNSQTVRGYPDVAANGANYVVAIDGSLSTIYGTSASAPTFGSIITLINEQRAKAGKSSVGFINPTIYANPGDFNDITKGGNQGCGTAGFTAVTGWDPVTGLGTPNYQKLLSTFMAMS